ADATTYLRGDGSWATVTGSGGFVGTAKRIIIGGSGTNADGSIENTLATTGTSATVNNAILAVPSAVGTTNVNLVLSPKGTGALIGGPAPDGLATGGGNARGAGALDLQTSRTTATQVASNLSSIALGSSCTASGPTSIVIGVGSSASGTNSISIGNGCTNTGSNFVAGRGDTAASSSSCNRGGVALVGGTSTSGYNNIAIGDTSVANSQYGAVALGNNLKATGNSSIALGSGSYSDRSGMVAYAYSQMSAQGDNQWVNFVLRGQTLLTTSAAELLIDTLPSVPLTIPPGKTMAFTVHVVGTKVGGNDGCYFIRKGIIKNIATTTSLVGPVVEETVYAGTGGTATCVVDAVDSTVDYLRIRVATPWTAAETWNWTAYVLGIERNHA
ncbi:Head domain of trimeric autotransporter adhesin, partial [uncultured Caudovirales phage]